LAASLLQQQQQQQLDSVLTWFVETCWSLVGVRVEVRAGELKQFCGRCSTVSDGRRRLHVVVLRIDTEQINI